MADADVSEISDKIFDAINVIRHQHKKRPDRDSVYKVISKEIYISRSEFEELTDILIKKDCINVKTSHGKESFFVNEDVFEDRLANLIASLSDNEGEESPDASMDEVTTEESEEQPEKENQEADTPSDFIEDVWIGIEKRVAKFFISEHKERQKLIDAITALREETKQLRAQITKAEKIFSSTNSTREVLASSENIKSNKKSKQTIGTQTASTTAQIAHSNEANIVKSLTAKISTQLIEVRNRNKKKYYAHKELQNPKPTDIIDLQHSKIPQETTMYCSKKPQDTNIDQTSIPAIPQSDKTRELLPKQKNLNNKIDDKVTQVHPWKPGTTLIVGDSMLGGIQEAKMAPRNNVKVRSFPGATIFDMKDYLRPLLRKKPSRILIHVGTNDAPHSNAKEIVNELINLKNFVPQELNIPVIISSPVNRYDNENLSNIIRNVNAQLKNAHELDVINNDNIIMKHLGKRKLHLNLGGTSQLVRNFLSKMRKV